MNKGFPRTSSQINRTLLMMYQDKFDVIVIGCGHAGTEAAPA